MAQYKVPQDVEADDKLIGPFSFRQFVYLLIAAGLIMVAVFLFRLFPLLAIIPVPAILLLVVLALPIKKDQPMETYLAAIVSYYLKPRIRMWTAGQRESTIRITAPKIVEDVRTRDISGEEATHRLSFLADIVDTEGYAIKGTSNSLMRDDLVAEANAANDMFDDHHFDALEVTIKQDETERHDEVVRGMRNAIRGVEAIDPNRDKITRGFKDEDIAPRNKGPIRATNSIGGGDDLMRSPAVVLPGSPIVEKPVEKTNRVVQEETARKTRVASTIKPSIIELANNPDFSIQTIEKEAKRLKERDEGEVFISLH